MSKESKKELIKKKSYELFLSGNFQFASVNEIVKVCEVAKGTYYNYYQSKDEVYLDILQDHLKKWFDQTLIKISKEFRKENIVPLLIEGLFDDEIFLHLLSKTQLTEGENIEKQKLIDFKKDFFSMVDVLSDVLSLKLKIEKKETFHLFMQTYSLIIGIWHTSKVPYSLEGDASKIGSLYLNFKEDLTHMTMKIWQNNS
ncbi:TetR/AcrR family transcriptional regulator [Bacteriovoracales bacterium]|nr:TetR/AcrR family transcriptional regulator [Bacteriovoracales bacterium]